MAPLAIKGQGHSGQCSDYFDQVAVLQAKAEALKQELSKHVDTSKSHVEEYLNGFGTDALERSVLSCTRLLNETDAIAIYEKQQTVTDTADSLLCGENPVIFNLEKKSVPGVYGCPSNIIWHGNLTKAAAPHRSLF